MAPTLIETTHGFEAVASFGEGARELLEKSGLLEAVDEFLKQAALPTVAALSPAVPGFHFVTPLVAFLIYRRAKRHAKEEGKSLAKFEEEERAAGKRMEDYLKALWDPQVRADEARAREQIAHLTGAFAKREDVWEVSRKLDLILALTPRGVEAAEGAAAGARDFAGFAHGLPMILAAFDEIRRGVEEALRVAKENLAASERIFQNTEAIREAQQGEGELKQAIQNLNTLVQSLEETNLALKNEAGEGHSQIAQLEKDRERLGREIEEARKARDEAERKRDEAKQRLRAKLHRDADRAQKLQPRFAASLAAALGSLAEDEPEKAKEYVRDAETANREERGRIAAAYGDIALLEGDATAAARWYNKASNELPDDPEMLLAVARAKRMEAETEPSGLEVAARLREATATLKEALAMLERQRGADDGTTVAGVEELADLYEQQFRYAEALPLRLRVVECLRRQGDTRSERFLDVLNAVFTNCYQGGTYAIDLPYATERQDLSEEMFGPHHPVTLVSTSNLATIYHSLGRNEEALALQTSVLAVRREHPGLRHRDTLLTMGNLAAIYLDMGRREEALMLQEEALGTRQEVLGPRHLDTLVGMVNVAETYREMERYEDALALHKEALDAWREVLGPTHPYTLGSMGNLAETYREMGRYEQAAVLGEETLALRREVLGPNHATTLSCLNNLALAYWGLGREDDAFRLMTQAVAGLEATLGRNHPRTSRSRESLEIYRAALAGEEGKGGESSQGSG